MRIDSEAVLRAALGAGATLLDTADVYAFGDNERLVGRVLAAHRNESSQVRIATKAGLVREGTEWRREGRAKHLVEACERSLASLGVASLDILQLHAPDPSVPIETSVRALASMLDRGLARALGVSNVGVTELSRACEVAPISFLQVELGPFSEGSIKSGVVRDALSRGMTVLAYAPFGGPRRTRRIGSDPDLLRVARRIGKSPFEVALAYLRDVHPRIVPLPGPSTEEHAVEAVRAQSIVLDDEARAVLDAKFPRLASLRPKPTTSMEERASDAPSASLSTPEIVVLMGSPAAGKSTLVHEFVGRGYERLNRDEKGGKLDALAREIDARLAAGESRHFVLDNTYGTRAMRYTLIEVAKKHGASVRCLWLTTSVPDAQINACIRMLAKHGRLLEPHELRAAAKTDPNTFPPNVLFNYQKAFEPPDPVEGFDVIESLAFERRPLHADRRERALLVDLDAAAWRSKRGARAPLDPDDVEVDEAALERLRRAAEEGSALWAIAWQPPEDGRTTPEHRTAIRARFDELVGARVDLRVCTHAAGPPVCWCRKPLPGLAVWLCHDHRVSSSNVTFVGASTIDATFAERLGFRYVAAKPFFQAPR